MSIVFGADGSGSMRNRHEVFPEDKIQLIGIEARVFDDLADLETERQFSGWSEVKQNGCVSFYTFV
jgi:hypothetical protein